MANEARVQTSLQIRKTVNNVPVLDYQSRPSAFNATVTGTKGPSPGAITVSTFGTDVDLSELVTPGLCRFMNEDSINYVEYGVFDGVSFFPLGELLPGESYVLRLSRNIGEEYAGTGTGTTAPINTLRFKANFAACVVLVEAFEK